MEKTNLNVNPYYDDFSEDKNFHRVLFRPGFAVQARELTQTQSILQNQIERFGDHFFKEGSLVTGAQTDIDMEVYFVKVTVSDAVEEGTPVAPEFAPVIKFCPLNATYVPSDFNPWSA